MSIVRILKESWKGYQKHRVGDLAAMLTYYSLFALFPFALFLVTITLLILPASTLEQAFQIIAVALPGQVAELALEQLHRLEATAGGGFVAIGALLALWGASRGAVALQTALNEIHEVKERRPWWKVQLVAIATTLGVSMLIVVALSLLVFGPMLGHFIADRFGLGTVFDIAFGIGRWVGAALLIMLVWACLYYFLPDIKRRFRWVTPGAVAGVLFWLAASRGFTFYAENFSSYDKTYGTLGAIIVFLTWIWLSCMALLIGGEIDDSIDELRKQSEPAGEVQKTPSPGVNARASKEEHIVERDIRVSPEPALGQLAKRVGDDLTLLAKDHFELARIELSTGLRGALVDGGGMILGGIVALVGLGMLCVTLVVAAEPLLASLALRLLLGAFLYLALGGGLVYAFVQKLRGEKFDLKRTRVEAQRTAHVLKEQVTHG